MLAFNDNGFLFDLDHRRDFQPAMPWSATVNNGLVVGAGHKMSTKSARVNLFEVLLLFIINRDGDPSQTKIGRRRMRT